MSYANPANLKRVEYPWKEIHAGITVTLTELKIDGISVADSTTGAKTVEHSDRELTALTGLLEDKLDDMAEGWSRTFNLMLWKDGTQDAKQVAGIMALITDDPTTGVIGGLDRATVTWWRSRAMVGANKITASENNQTLTKTLRTEIRQLIRYGGKPDLVLAGSDFIGNLETEIQAKGIYTQQGFANNGKNDIGMGQISIRGIGDVNYDPTLDDLGFSKRCYFIDTKGIGMRVMDGEDKKTHSPARPATQYALYRAMTWTGGLVAQQLNSSGVYEVA